MSLLDLDFNYYYRIYVNVHTMMKDRGYEPKKDMLTGEKYMSKMLGYIGETDDNPLTFLDKIALTFVKNGDKSYVYFFILPVKIKKVDIEHIYNILEKKGIKNLVLITKEKLTPAVNAILKTFPSQSFYESELIINPTNNILQPKFEVLDENSKKKVLDDYKTDISRFPGIPKDGSIVKWFNLEINDMLKITRKNGDIYYRVVREL